MFHVYELHVQHMLLTVQNLVYQLEREKECNDQYFRIQASIDDLTEISNMTAIPCLIFSFNS